MPYRIRVTPKAGGDRQHVCGLRNGPTPKIGVELDVILGDRRICARVTDINLPVSKMGGAPVDDQRNLTERTQFTADCGRRSMSLREVGQAHGGKADMPFCTANVCL